jgi:protein ImuB
MHPDLILRPADPEADLAFLDRLALWALRFTPSFRFQPAGRAGVGRPRLH